MEHYFSLLKILESEIFYLIDGYNKVRVPKNTEIDC